MPEMHFTIEWPNGKQARCYSPSYIIEDFLNAGQAYPVAEFLTRVGAALEGASGRVRERYGFACSSALDQLSELRRSSAELTEGERARDVLVLAFEKHAPRDARVDSGESSPLEASLPSQLGSGLDDAHLDVVVVGAGQAGLSMSHVLKQAGIRHVVLEKNRLAHAWRAERWDSFCLVTPNWQCQLPGHPYAGDDPNGFMLKHEIVEYLEQYARSFRTPLLEGVAVERVARATRSSGQSPCFEIHSSAGVVTADHVVVATGGYHDPFVPACSERLSSLVQIHSRDYTNPASLPEGDVLVVGTGQSGCQIAEDLLLAGRKVHLSVGSAPRCARRYRGKDVVEWLNLMGHYELPVDKHPSKEAVRDKTNHYVTGRDGGRDIDLRDFARRGMSLYGTFQDAEGQLLRFAPDLSHNLDAADAVYDSINRSIDAFIEQRGIEAPPGSRYVPPWVPASDPLLLDLAQTNVRSVVWAIGFRTNFSWLDLPVLDSRGLPQHVRGVTSEPGLFFLGLPWQYTWGSGRFCGVGRDATYLGRQIAEALSQRLGRAAVALG